MKRVVITVFQVVFVLIFGCVFYFSSAPGTVSIVLFTVLMLILIIVGNMMSRASEKRMKDRITELLRELNVASSRIGSVSQEIGITIDESDKSSSELFLETRVMSELMGDVTENLDGMIARLKGMISFSEEARTTAQTIDRSGKDSLTSVSNGMAEIMRIIDTMKEIKITSTKAGDSIEKLGAASAGIRTIAEKINDISKQMHIIAINATVEASRAGRFGSSFAVVAKEFHSLSDMTDNSLREICAFIDAIQTDITGVCDTVRANTDRVDEGVRHTKVVEDSLKNIYASFTEMTRMISRINSIAAEESLLMGDMRGYIDNVESLIDKTNGNVRRVFESAHCQKKGIENIAEMGAKLNNASVELLDITGSSAGETTEKLDEKTQRLCANFIPRIREALADNPDILLNDRDGHYNILSRFKSLHNIAEAVWTNETNGRFICSIPKAGIANAAMRDWFRAALKGESYISPIYISGITKNRCVTLSLPYHDADGTVTGIIGVDLNLDMLRKLY